MSTSEIASQDSSVTVQLFQRAHGRMVMLQRIDEQFRGILAQRQRVQDELKGIQAQINEEFDRVVNQSISPSSAMLDRISTSTHDVDRAAEVAESALA